MTQPFTLPKCVYDAFKAHGIRVIEVWQSPYFPERWQTTLECWSSLVGTFRLLICHEPDLRDFSVQLTKAAHEIDTDQEAVDLFERYVSEDDRKPLSDLMDAAEAVQHRFVLVAKDVSSVLLAVA